MPYAHFTYTVIGQRVVAPTDVEAAVANVGYTRLVLSACTPLFSAAKRLLVYARLTRTVPVGAARGCRAAWSPRPHRSSARAPARPGVSYHRCSNPSIRNASPRSSDSATPGSPPLTSPTQLTRVGPVRARASARSRSSAAAQKHSS